jgi:SulP family sulfate permease
MLKELPFSKIFILQMLAIPVIDASGMFALKEFYEKCKKNGTILFLSGIHGKVRLDLKRFGLVDLIKEENIFSNLDSALSKAKEILRKDST